MIASVVFEAFDSIIFYVKFFFALDFSHKAFVTATIVCALLIVIVLIEEMFYR